MSSSEIARWNPRALLHIRQSLVVVGVPEAPSDLDRTTTWQCYGTFDRLLVSQTNELSPACWDDQPPESVAATEELLVPIEGASVAGWHEASSDYAILGVHHLKFERSPKGETRRPRFRLERLQRLLDALRRTVPPDECLLSLNAGLHWHELVLLTLTNNLDHLLSVAVHTRARAMETLDSRVLTSQSVVATKVLPKGAPSIPISGSCLASIRIGCLTHDPLSVRTALERRITTLLEHAEVSRTQWEVEPILGNLDFVLRLSSPIRLETLVELIHQLRIPTEDQDLVIRSTETTISPQCSRITAAPTGTQRHIKRPADPVTRFNDSKLRAAIDTIETKIGRRDVGRELRAIFRYADSVLCDALLAPAALDLCNPLEYLRSQTILAAARDEGWDDNRSGRLLILQRMTQRLEYALRSRTSAASVLLPSSVHPAVLHGSHALHYRIIEALSSVPLMLLGPQWHGCVLLGWGNAIQLFEGATFGTPVSWFSALNHWWALVHEVGHQVAIDTDLLSKDALKQWYETHVGQTLRPGHQFTLSESKWHELRLLHLAEEVFADLFELHLAFRRSWDKYVQHVWRYYKQRPLFSHQRVEHLLRALCVYAASDATGADETCLEAGLSCVIEDCRPFLPKDTTTKPAALIRCLETAGGRLQPAFDAVLGHLRKQPHIALTTAARDADTTPLDMLRDAISLDIDDCRPNHHQRSGPRQAALILAMAEWYRENRRLMSQEEISHIRSVV